MARVIPNDYNDPRRWVIDGPDLPFDFMEEYGDDADPQYSLAPSAEDCEMCAVENAPGLELLALVTGETCEYI